MISDHALIIYYFTEYSGCEYSICDIISVIENGNNPFDNNG